MAESGAKIRFAMGFFREPRGLREAIGALVGLGLDECDIGLAGERSALERNGAGHWADRTATVLTLSQPAALPVLCLFHHEAAWAADAPIMRALRGDACGQPGCLTVTDFWRGLHDRLRAGDMLLIVKVPSAALQDAAMRALLRHSDHPVHAEEFRPGC